MKKVLAGILIYAVMAIAIAVLFPYVLLEKVIIYVSAIILLLVPIYAYISVSNHGKTIKKVLRGKIFSLLSHQKECKKLMINENVKFHNPKHIKIGNNVSIDNGAEFFPLGQGHPSQIIIGNNVHIGSYNRFASMNKVEIEDDVLFAAFVHITDHSHEFRDIHLPVRSQGVYTKGPVKICTGAWLGFRCNILSGVTVGEHSVVAAGAVVTKDVPPYSVVAGCPAKVIKKYDFEKEEWVSV